MLFLVRRANSPHDHAGNLAHRERGPRRIQDKGTRSSFRAERVHERGRPSGFVATGAVGRCCGEQPRAKVSIFRRLRARPHRGPLSQGRSHSSGARQPVDPLGRPPLPSMKVMTGETMNAVQPCTLPCARLLVPCANLMEHGIAMRDGREQTMSNQLARRVSRGPARLTAVMVSIMISSIV
jgi:hypothetical protein